MIAKYFYNRLLGYDEEVERTERYYYGYCNHVVTIHHKNDNSIWYCIHNDGNVYLESMEKEKTDIILSLDDLKGDDFELFNPVQILKSGYLILDGDPNINSSYVITKLHHHVKSFSFDNIEHFNDKISDTKKIPVLCGESIWKNGLTSEIQFYTTNGIEINLKTIKELCEYNINRKHYDAQCIPFIKSMKNKNSIHVSFIDNMWTGDYEEKYKKCDSALIELLKYVHQIKINCKWVECTMKNPIYY